MLEVIMRGFKAQTTYDGFDKCDLVIEAVIEDLKLKQDIFSTLEKVCNPNCILATNTSTIDIDKIATKTTAQNRIIGLHFFSPAHVMQLLEIVRTEKTDAQTISTCLAMSKKIEKIPVVVGNCVGFTANRIFFPYGQAANLLTDCGVDPYHIDAALEKFGMPMGVHKMMDLSGLDVFAHVSAMINSAYGERCYNSTLGHKLVGTKRLGQKTAAGFYLYKPGSSKAIPDEKTLPSLVKQARADAANKGPLPTLPATAVTDKTLVEMILYPVVNESLRVQAEGHVIRALDIDVCSVLGYGFPAFKGGVLFWASQKDGGGGWKHIRDRLRTFSESLGMNNVTIRNFFAPCEALEHAAAME